jgi:hypothetical protein
METKKKNVDKDIDIMKTIRAIKEKISKDIYGLSFEEIKQYLKNQPSIPAVG